MDENRIYNDPRMKQPPHGEPGHDCSLHNANMSEILTEETMKRLGKLSVEEIHQHIDEGTVLYLREYPGLLDLVAVVIKGGAHNAIALDALMGRGPSAAPAIFATIARVAYDLGTRVQIQG
jgi:hypothetical protein